MDGFKILDWHRMFIGDGPPVFLLKIIFRTVSMYVYTIFLLRILGKRSIGQLPTLELAIIIYFGSAVGNLVIGKDIPMVYGMVAITAVAFLQVGFEQAAVPNDGVYSCCRCGYSTELKKQQLLFPSSRCNKEGGLIISSSTTCKPEGFQKSFFPEHGIFSRCR